MFTICLCFFSFEGFKKIGLPPKKKNGANLWAGPHTAIVLAFIQMMWQNQYNLTHLTVFKSTCVLLPGLEAIERVMVEKQNEKLKVKVKATAARPDAKSSPKRKTGSSD